MRADVLIVTEGGPGIGLGHIMETVHICEALQRHGCNPVCLAFGPTEVLALLGSRGIRVDPLTSRFDASSVAGISSVARALRARIVLCNVMRLDPKGVVGLRAAGLVVAAITEGGDKVSVDILFDVLANPALMVLSPEIMRVRRMGGPASNCSVLLTMGGYDASGMTPRLVRWIAEMDNPPPLRIVVGKGFAQGARLLRVADRYPSLCQVFTGLPQVELFKLMYGSSAAITHGGDTLYELACLGVPVLTVCPTARQLRVARAFARSGNAINLGLFDRLQRDDFQRAVQRIVKDGRLRRRLGTRGRRLVDGRGAERVAEALVHVRRRKAVGNQSQAWDRPSHPND